VTLSFVPDGTDLGGVTSNLFSTFNARFGSAATWQNQILKAAQQWAQQTNLNFAVVSDSGAPSGSGLFQQGDPTFGDIRIGGYNYGSSVLASAYAPPPVNNYSIAGDINFNTGQGFNIGTTYDLFTVAVHEFGHALGLLHSSLITADMYSAYNGVKPGLSSDDVSAVRSVYSGNNPRSADAYDAGGGNNSFAAATNVTSLIDPVLLTGLVTNQDITTTSDVDYFKVTAPAGTLGTVTVGVQSGGLSLLAPKVTVYAADQTTVLGSASGAGQYGASLTVNLLNKVSAGQVMYVKVQGADATALGTGAYALRLSFGALALPSVPLPTTQLLNGNPLSGGGGIANAVAQPFVAAPPTGQSYQGFAESPQTVAMDAAGDYVLAWSAYDAGSAAWRVDAQLFTPDGTPRTGVLSVSTQAGDQMYPAVAMDAAGNFVVTWAAYGADGDGWAVRARQFDAGGNPLGGEFLVNQFAAGDQVYPAAARNAAGNFVITWSSQNQDGSGWGVYARRYDASGQPLGSEFRVNARTAGDQQNSTVGMDDAGNAVVVWASQGQDGSGWGVYGRRFDPSGAAVGGEMRINSYTAGDQRDADVAMDRQGDFIVVWASQGQDGSGWGVYGQRYDNTGATVDGEFRANTTTAGDQDLPRVGMGRSGDFLITWSSNGGGGAYKAPGLPGQSPLNGNSMGSSDQGTSTLWGVYAQQYDEGQVAGGEFRVNTLTGGDNTFSAVAMAPSGRVVAMWNNKSTGGGPGGISSQRYVIGADNLDDPCRGSAPNRNGAEQAASLLAAAGSATMAAATTASVPSSHSNPAAFGAVTAPTEDDRPAAAVADQTRVGDADDQPSAPCCDAAFFGSVAVRNATLANDGPSRPEALPDGADDARRQGDAPVGGEGASPALLPVGLSPSSCDQFFAQEGTGTLRTSNGPASALFGQMTMVGLPYLLPRVAREDHRARGAGR
jgi:hypothetical protein